MTVLVGGETMEARPDHTLFWPSEGVLFVADVHLGKAAAFRALGRMALPTGTTVSTLGRLEAALGATGARELVILGDLWHARAGRDAQTLGEFAAFRERWFHVKTTLVEGNHDRRSGTLPPEFGVEEVEEGARRAPLVLRHHPEADDGGYVLAGHVHPGVVMTGGGGALKLPCFWFGPRVGLLPAFGDFTGLGIVSPAVGDDVLVVAEGRIVRVGSKSRPRASR